MSDGSREGRRHRERQGKGEVGLSGGGVSRDTEQMEQGWEMYLGAGQKGILSAEKQKTAKPKVIVLCNHHKQFYLIFT